MSRTTFTGVRASRKGVINMQEIWAIIAIILIALLIFTFFLIARENLKDQFTPGDMNAEFGVSTGSLYLEAYLRTPLNASGEPYGLAEMPTVDLTVEKALPLLLADEPCADWLRTNLYTQTNKLLAATPPSELCGVFAVRTRLFFEAVCAPQYFSLKIDNKAETILVNLLMPIPTTQQEPGKLEPIARGGINVPAKLAEEQKIATAPPYSYFTSTMHVAAEQPITVTLSCRERYGVILE